MGTLVNYLRWRGDISFKNCPLTPMDSVAWGQISYFYLNNVYVPGKKQKLGELYDRQLAGAGFISRSLDPPDRAEAFFRAVDAAKRFRDSVILDYTDIYEADKNIQFSAMTLRLDDRSIVVIFRGTDDSLAGWREDFMISFTMPEAQKLALEYLKKMLKWHRTVYVCGHSKGANLALYAASLLSDRELKKLKAVYLNDGPGLCEEIVSKEQVKRIDPVTTMIRPYDSVVGRIFEPELTNSIIVKTDVSGIMAHSGYSWLIEDNGFVKEESFSKASKFIHDRLDKWLKTADLEQRENIVNSSFDTLKEAGYETLGDFKENGFSELFGVFKRRIGTTLSNIQPKEILMNTVEDTKELILNTVDDIKSKIIKPDDKEK